jgi:hypothetical protein
VRVAMMRAVSSTCYKVIVVAVLRRAFANRSAAKCNSVRASASMSMLHRRAALGHEARQTRQGPSPAILTTTPRYFDRRASAWRAGAGGIRPPVLPQAGCLRCRSTERHRAGRQRVVKRCGSGTWKQPIATDYREQTTWMVSSVSSVEGCSGYGAT